MKKNLLLSAFIILALMPFRAQAAVKIIESAGWLESAYIKWEPSDGADSYNVYYSGEGISSRKIDGMLIRRYPGCFRADVVGLKAGSYTLKVVPVTEEAEDEAGAAVSENLTVEAYTREGFSFLPASPFKTGSGAYNDDGTLRAGAKVIYLTSKNANTVELDVVTNSKGKIEKGVGIVDILAKKQKGYDKTPLAVRVVGEVRGSSISGLNSSGYIQIKGKGAYSEMNITFEGIGDDAAANGWAFLVRNAGNVEIRNLGIMNFLDDGVSLDTENTNVWVHNNDFFYGKQGSGDKAKGDGSFDVKGNSKYVTSSYNHFWDSGKSSLCGMTSESGDNYISYHHNWFDHSDSRHPRVRTMTVHVYNNYFDGVSKYGVGATMGSSVFVENNYFRSCKYPMLISKQGTDVFYDSKGTFSGENGGMIKAYGNIIIGAKRFVDQHTAAAEFDAVTVSARDEEVPASYKALVGGTAYNNFDTNPALMYSYSVETAEDAKESVVRYAGRVNGGDLKWTFDNSVDDTSYDINKGLREAVNNYKGTVLAIGFGEDGGGPVDPDPVDPPVVDPGAPGTMVHNFTTDGTSSSFFAIAGSLSDSKGTVEYKGLTLTDCLKMESKTSIAFTTTEEGTLTLVFNAGFSGRVKINGENHYASAGVLSMTIPAGNHTVEKGDTSNLYYMSVLYPNPPSGIENPSDINFHLYPNPTAGSLYISSEDEIYSIEVYSLMGAVVFRAEGQPAAPLDLGGLKAGSYLVKIHTARGTAGRLIVKK